MCRSIKPLFNFEPPASNREVHEAALQFVRKVSGYAHPSQANRAVFEHAVEDIERTVERLLAELETSAPRRDRETVAAKARERAKARDNRERASVR